MERDRQMDLIRTEKTIHKVVNELCRPDPTSWSIRKTRAGQGHALSEP
jgi:hypothetical protein